MNAPAPARVSDETTHDTWNTPEWVLDLVRSVAQIALDPCSNQWSTVRAAREYRLERGEDGLLLPWPTTGLVFVNPPYGKPVAAWAERMALHATHGCEILALIPANVGTRWFHAHVITADVLLFWRRRISFVERGVVRPANTQDMCSPYWGPNANRVREVFSRHCWWR